MKLQKTKASVIVLVVLNASLAVAQTNPSKASPVGTWELDLKQSTFGSDPPPKSMTLTILEPDDSAWRIDAVDSEGKSQSFSWSGPVDGTLQPVKSADGQEIGRESLQRDGDALVRKGQEAAEGTSFDARATMSADGNTITDVVTMKSKDGKTSTQTSVYHRSTATNAGGR